MSSNHRTYYNIFICKDELNTLVPEDEAFGMDYTCEVIANYDSHDMIGISKDTLEKMLTHTPLDLHYVETWWYDEETGEQMFSHWYDDEGMIDYSLPRVPISLKEFLQNIAVGNKWLREQLAEVEAE